MTLNFESEDIGSNPSDNRTFHDVLDTFVSRRAVIADRRREDDAALEALNIEGTLAADASACRTAVVPAAKHSVTLEKTSRPFQETPSV